MAAGLSDDDELREELKALLKNNSQVLSTLSKTLEGLTSAIRRNKKLNDKMPKSGSGGGGSGDGSDDKGKSGASSGSSSSSSSDNDDNDDKSLDKLFNDLGNSIGAHLRAALNSSHVEGGGGGHGRDNEGVAQSAQQSRLNQMVLNDELKETITQSYVNLVKETNRLTEDMLKSFVTDKIRQGSEFLSGRYALDSFQDRWQNGLEASSRNLSGTVETFGSDLMSITTGAMGLDAAIKRITNNISDGGAAFAAYKGDVKGFGKELKDSRTAIKGINIDRQLSGDEQYDYLTSLYEQQVKMGISNQLNTEFMRQAAKDQLSTFQMVAKNTGETVKNLIELNKKSEVMNFAREMQARYGDDPAQLQTVMSKWSGLAPETQKQLESILSKDVLHAYMVGGRQMALGELLKTKTGVEAMSLNPVLDTLDELMSSNQRTTQEMNAIAARNFGKVADNVKDFGPILGNVLAKDISVMDFNNAAASAQKLAEDANPEKSYGWLEGAYNWLKRQTTIEQPWIKAGMDSISAMAGLANGLIHLTEAVKGNTLATNLNTLSQAGIFKWFSKIPFLGKILSKLPFLGAPVAGAAAEKSLTAAGGKIIGNLAAPAAKATSSLVKVGGALLLAFTVFDAIGNTVKNWGKMKDQYKDQLDNDAPAQALAGWVKTLAPVGIAIVGALTGPIGLGIAAAVIGIDKMTDGAISKGIGWLAGKAYQLGKWSLNWAKNILKTLWDGLTFSVGAIWNGVVTVLAGGTKALDFLKVKHNNPNNLFDMAMKGDGSLVEKRFGIKPLQAKQSSPVSDFKESRAELIKMVRDDGKSSVNGVTDEKLIKALSDANSLSTEMLDALKAIKKNTKGASIIDSTS